VIDLAAGKKYGIVKNRTTDHGMKYTVVDENANLIVKRYQYEIDKKMHDIADKDSRTAILALLMTEGCALASRPEHNHMILRYLIRQVCGRFRNRCGDIIEKVKKLLRDEQEQMCGMVTLFDRIRGRMESRCNKKKYHVILEIDNLLHPLMKKFYDIITEANKKGLTDQDILNSVYDVLRRKDIRDDELIRHVDRREYWLDVAQDTIVDVMERADTPEKEIQEFVQNFREFTANKTSAKQTNLMKKQITTFEPILAERIAWNLSWNIPEDRISQTAVSEIFSCETLKRIYSDDRIRDNLNDIISSATDITTIYPAEFFRYFCELDANRTDVMNRERFMIMFMVLTRNTPVITELRPDFKRCFGIYKNFVSHLAVVEGLFVKPKFKADLYNEMRKPEYCFIDEKYRMFLRNTYPTWQFYPSLKIKFIDEKRTKEYTSLCSNPLPNTLERKESGYLRYGMKRYGRAFTNITLFAVDLSTIQNLWYCYLIYSLLLNAENEEQGVPRLNPDTLVCEMILNRQSINEGRLRFYSFIYEREILPS
jgi:hypothetical protein